MPAKGLGFNIEKRLFAIVSIFRNPKGCQKSKFYVNLPKVCCFLGGNELQVVISHSKQELYDRG